MIEIELAVDLTRFQSIDNSRAEKQLQFAVALLTVGTLLGLFCLLRKDQTEVCTLNIVAANLPDPHGLDVHELPNAELAQFSTIAGMLHAAERQARIRGDHPVDEDTARFQFVDEA